MTTANKVLIYDDACPLCAWYTSLFVKYKLLSPGGRIAFSAADARMLSLIDVERGRNEIPFVDIHSGKVSYGLDALLDILGQKLPFIPIIGNLKPVKWFLLRLYKLISYNRKVIVATKCGHGKFDCAPAFSMFYRLLFMLIFFIFNTVMLIPVHHFILNHLSFYHLTSSELQTGHLIFAATNCLLALFLNPRTAVEYLGQVNMLALITILLLMPLMLINNLLFRSEIFSLAYLSGLTLFVVKEYFRRMRYAGILSSRQLIAGINLTCMLLFVMYLFS